MLTTEGVAGLWLAVRVSLVSQLPHAVRVSAAAAVRPDWPIGKEIFRLR